MIAENAPQDDGHDDLKLLTQGDLARRLRISIRQVRRLDTAGSLPRPLMIGALKRWDPDEIAAKRPEATQPSQNQSPLSS